jgi:hypothetical protein
MRGAIRPLPQYIFMAWCLVKLRDLNMPVLYMLNFCLDLGFSIYLFIFFGTESVPIAQEFDKHWFS